MTFWPVSVTQTTVSERRSPSISAAALLLVLAITAGIVLGWREIERLGSYGYPAVLLLSFFGNATVILPAPGMAVVAVAGSFLDPVAVGLVAGLGAALGEMTGYLAGYSGQHVLQDRPLYARLEALMKRNGTMAIFLLSAVPNPLIDVGGLTAGALRMSAWRFLLAAWAGKTLRFALLAALAAKAI